MSEYERPLPSLIEIQPDECPDCGRASCTGEGCYWPDDAGLPRPAWHGIAETVGLWPPAPAWDITGGTGDYSAMAAECQRGAGSYLDDADPNPLPEGVDPLWPTEPSFTCPRCSRTSWNPNDVREGYCGACHDWTGGIG